MSSRKVENLSQIVNAIHPGPKEPGFLAVISVKLGDPIRVNAYEVFQETEFAEDPEESSDGMRMIPGET